MDKKILFTSAFLIYNAIVGVFSFLMGDKFWTLMDRVDVPSGFFTAYMVMVGIATFCSIILIFWLLRAGKKEQEQIDSLANFMPIPKPVVEVPKEQSKSKFNLFDRDKKPLDLPDLPPIPKVIPPKRVDILRDTVENVSMYEDKPKNIILKPIPTPPAPRSIPPPIYTPEQLDDIPALEPQEFYYDDNATATPYPSNEDENRYY